MLKTISEYEFKILMQIGEAYFWHVHSNPSTTLAKILGIFQFEGFEVGRIQLIMMKNIGKISSDAYLRSYDLKGSSHDREVLKINKNSKSKSRSSSSIRLAPEDLLQSRSKFNFVLKDLDFLKLEKNVHISIKDADLLYKQLDADTLFLKG